MTPDQIATIQNIVETANAQAGWTAGLLAFLTLAGFGVLGFIVRQLWQDHRELNTFTRNRMAAVFSRVARSLDRLTNILAAQPCLAHVKTALDDLAKEARDEAADDTQEPPATA